MPQKTIPALAGRTVRCFLFDLGDTLWTRHDKTAWYTLENDSNQQAVDLLRKHIAAQYIPVMNDNTLGSEIRKSIEKQIRDWKRRNPEYEPDFADVSLAGLQQIGIIGIDRQSAAAVFEALRVRIPESRSLFKDALSTLEKLRQRGFVLGVVTNRSYGGKPFLEDLEKLGLLNYFDPASMAISADLGIRKPNPAIFQHALGKLGMRTEEAVMVGDSLSADVAGANKSNIFAIWKPKATLLAEARAAQQAANISSTLPISQNIYSLEKARLEQDQSTLELNINSPDDEYLVAYTHSRESKWKKQQYHESKPDMIIEHLSDLLDVFLKAGIQ